MDKFCGSPLWDGNLTWYTEHPNFTICFKKTVFQNIPFVFLWMLAPCEAYNCYKSLNKNISINWYNGIKLMAIFILIIFGLKEVCFYTFAKNKPLIFICSATVQFVTYVLLFLLTCVNIKVGNRSSGILFIFSFLLLVCQFPEFYSNISKHNPMHNETTQFYIVSETVHYCLIVALFLLNSFADSAPKYSIFDANEVNISIEKKSSFLSKLVFFWFDGLAYRTYKNQIDADDLQILDHENTSIYITSAYNINKKFKDVKNREKSFDECKPNLLTLLIGFSIIPLIITFTMKFVDTACMLGSIQLIIWLIDFMSEDTSLWKGQLLGVVFFLTFVVAAVITAHYERISAIYGLRIRTLIVTLVYKKALRISNSARKEFSSGEIVNLMSTDAEKFMPVLKMVNLILSSIYSVIIMTYILWTCVGSVSFVSILLIILLKMVNLHVAKNKKYMQNLQMTAIDKRIKLMTEILSGIKIVKLYSWESGFENEIKKIRNVETGYLHKQFLYSVILLFLWTVLPTVITFVTFTVYLLSNAANTLDMKTTFITLAVMNHIRITMYDFGLGVTNFTEFIVAYKRINRFLNSEELCSVVTSEKSGECIVIKNASFSWENTINSAILKNINLTVPDNNLTAIVGSVGSGKSSLISAILGELYKYSGYINCRGKVSYVPQNGWIINGTVKDNILMGQKVSENYYRSVLRACALLPDLETFPGGDMAEIGENGINLSGGQNQRVNLARALCFPADIYLFDDPLSAVDAEVGKYIFKNVLGPCGMLKGKCRVMVTHNYSYLPETDYIYFLKDGSIVESGTYFELLKLNKNFAGLLKCSSNEDRTPKECCTQEDSVLKKGDTHKDRSQKWNSDVARKLVEMEDMQKGNIKKTVFDYYLIHFGRCLIWMIVLYIVSYYSFSFGATVWLLVWSTNEENGNTKNTNDRLYYICIQTVFILGQAIFSILLSWTLYSGGFKVSVKLHDQLLHHVLHWPMIKFDMTPIGRIINRFGNDLLIIDNSLITHVSMIAGKLGIVIASWLIIVYCSYWFLVILIPTIALLFLIQRIYVSVSQELKRSQLISTSPLYSHLQETMSGITSIRAFGMQLNCINLLYQKLDHNNMYNYSDMIAKRWLALRVEVIEAFLLFCSIMFAITRNDLVQSGLLILSVIYALQIIKSCSWIVEYFANIETFFVSVERIKEYVDSPQEIGCSVPNTYLPSDWPNEGNVEFINYSLRYREDDDLVLKGLSFSISPGEKIGIVGRTGAGKSSLTLGLFRIMEPASGTIIIDGIDISSIGLHQLRSRLSMIPQEPVLFSGTLRLNLDPHQNYSDDDLWNALKRAHLKKFIQTLAEKLSFCVSEGGNNLSVGQRQLLCLARALLKRTKILVLDEATAAVDVETDGLIQKTIREEFKESTIITIAHRLNTVMDYDRILVLQDGQLIEYDSPKELLKSENTKFYELVKDAGLI